MERRHVTTFTPPGGNHSPTWGKYPTPQLNLYEGFLTCRSDYFADNEVVRVIDGIILLLKAASEGGLSE